MITKYAERNITLKKLSKLAYNLYNTILKDCIEHRWGHLEEHINHYHQLLIESYNIGILVENGPIQPVVCHLRGRDKHPTNEEKKKLLELMRKSFDLACSCEEHLCDLAKQHQKNNDLNNALSCIESICNKFHIFCLCLCKSIIASKKIKVLNEYDVQKLMYVLLSMDFKDIRVEEAVPSRAGSCARMDFLIMPFGIGIETKMTRENLIDKNVAEQLSIDIMKYKKHPDCKMLVCFIYDPDGHIRNATQITHDLESEQTRKLKVKVYITPTR